MGKVAENERIKLRATFYNNIAISLVIVGTAIPSFAVFFRAYEFGKWLNRWQTGVAGIDRDYVVGVAAVLASMAAAGAFAYLFRQMADNEIKKIED
jgi:hypothetical protein